MVKDLVHNSWFGMHIRTEGGSALWSQSFRGKYCMSIALRQVVQLQVTMSLGKVVEQYPGL